MYMMQIRHSRSYQFAKRHECYCNTHCIKILFEIKDVQRTDDKIIVRAELRPQGSALQL